MAHIVVVNIVISLYSYGLHSSGLYILAYIVMGYIVVADIVISLYSYDLHS